MKNLWKFSKSNRNFFVNRKNQKVKAIKVSLNLLFALASWQQSRKKRRKWSKWESLCKNKKLKSSRNYKLSRQLLHSNKKLQNLYLSNKLRNLDQLSKIVPCQFQSNNLNKLWISKTVYFRRIVRVRKKSTWNYPRAITLDLRLLKLNKLLTRAEPKTTNVKSSQVKKAWF